MGRSQRALPALADPASVMHAYFGPFMPVAGPGAVALRPPKSGPR